MLVKKKTLLFATYGLFGLIGMDWLSLLVVILSDIIIGIIIVENMLRKIKKVPISFGGVTMTKIIDLKIKEKIYKNKKVTNLNLE